MFRDGKFIKKTKPQKALENNLLAFFVPCKNGTALEMSRTPKIIVFDLDYTLWPLWVDCCVTPFCKKNENEAVDAHGQTLQHCKDVPNILKELSNKGYELGIASRTSEIQGANQLLNIFGWDKYFKYKEIYPGSKVAHFSKIQKASGVKYEDMIFFDDEARNISDVRKLGVCCILVKNGVTHQVIEKALKDFQSH